MHNTILVETCSKSSCRNCCSVPTIRSTPAKGWRTCWFSYTNSIGCSSCSSTRTLWTCSFALGFCSLANNCNTWNRSWSPLWSWARLWTLWSRIAVNFSRYVLSLVYHFTRYLNMNHASLACVTWIVDQFLATQIPLETILTNDSNKF